MALLTGAPPAVAGCRAAGVGLPRPPGLPPPAAAPGPPEPPGPVPLAPPPWSPLLAPPPLVPPPWRLPPPVGRCRRGGRAGAADSFPADAPPGRAASGQSSSSVASAAGRPPPGRAGLRPVALVVRRGRTAPRPADRHRDHRNPRRHRRAKPGRQRRRVRRGGRGVRRAGSGGRGVGCHAPRPGGFDARRRVRARRGRACRSSSWSCSSQARPEPVRAGQRSSQAQRSTRRGVRAGAGFEPGTLDWPGFEPRRGVRAAAGPQPFEPDAAFELGAFELAGRRRTRRAGGGPGAAGRRRGAGRAGRAGRDERPSDTPPRSPATSQRICQRPPNSS